MVHDFDWRDVPGQDIPPLLGGGLLQLLYRFWEPVPHVLLQEPHPPQLDQPPFTTISLGEEYNSFTICTCIKPGRFGEKTNCTVNSHGNFPEKRITFYGEIRRANCFSSSFLPGQGLMVHDVDWRDVHGQDLPPFFGGGLLQLLYRFWEPVPHVLLQEPHPPQLDQPPFTTINLGEEYNSFTICICIKPGRFGEKTNCTVNSDGNFPEKRIRFQGEIRRANCF